ncbi:class I SAM-dependent DNA methyltransferase [Luteibaculum oceani]|uniref:Class I SAM-dependent methyltransferase n=1 Tax=Luteibaculum oceani TaxID=1294296 RepID=A0A5C6VEA3_9FLAO|nr:class I SAM-dependent methyltransferase [Luteibaculum oceani]TXC81408.1 class I SAM-dependent methyltransferase [Luteibaculum oceani]
MTFDKYSQYYDLFYDNKSYREEVNFVVDVINSHLNGNFDSLLDIGCGSGNHARYLASFFESITGVDRSDSMVKVANEKNIPNFKALEADVCSFNLGLTFGSAIALFHVFSYLNTNDQVLTAFTNVNNHLSVGGLFIFDVWNTATVYNQPPQVKVRREKMGLKKVVRITKPKLDVISNTVDVQFDFIIHDNYECIEFSELHRMRHYSPPEIELFCWKTGFEVIKSCDMISGAPLSQDTFSATYILRKIKEL